MKLSEKLIESKLLPEKKVDRFILRAYTVGDLEVDEQSWEFHLKTPCIEVIGIHGVIYENDWAYISHGQVKGRMSGWESLHEFLDSLYHDSMFFERAEAEKALAHKVALELATVKARVSKLENWFKEKIQNCKS